MSRSSSGRTRSTRDKRGLASAAWGEGGAKTPPPGESRNGSAEGSGGGRGDDKVGGNNGESARVTATAPL